MLTASNESQTRLSKTAPMKKSKMAIAPMKGLKSPSGSSVAILAFLRSSSHSTRFSSKQFLIVAHGGNYSGKLVRGAIVLGEYHGGQLSGVDCH